MPTGKINLPWLAARITEAELAELAARVKRRNDPRRGGLEQKRDKLLAALKQVEAEIVELSGGEKPTGKRPGRKPGRRAGKPANVAETPVAAQGKRGRPAGKRASRQNEATAKYQLPNAKMSPMLAAVITILREADGPMTVSEIAARLARHGVETATERSAQMAVGRLVLGTSRVFRMPADGRFELA